MILPNLGVTNTADDFASRMFLDARKFDIKANGREESKQLQNAFDYMQYYGGTLVMPASGLSLVSTPLIIQNSGWRILAHNWNYQIQAANNLNNYVIIFSQPQSAGITNSIIQNLHINGNNQNQSGGGCLNANGSYRNLFDNCFFDAPYQTGLLLQIGRAHV